MVHTYPDFDPRAWNLFVGVALLAGCGAGPLTGDGETSSTTDEDSGSEDTDGSEDTESDTNDDYYSECKTDEDCSYGGQYLGYCEDGECMPPSWGCLHEGHCSDSEICLDRECVPLPPPPPSCEFEAFEVPTSHVQDSVPLALSFADIDDDGQDELVVATETDLLVYEFGSNVPTVSAREVPSAAPTSMIAGTFDDQPGDDITLLVDDEYHRYFSDGVAGLVTPIIEPSPLVGASDLLAGDFDGQAPIDLVVWGDTGAVLDLSDTTVPLTAATVTDVAAFDYGSPAAGLAIVIEQLSDVILFDFMGGEHQSASTWFGVVGLAAPNAFRYLTARSYSSQVSEVQVRDATNLTVQSTIWLNYTLRTAAGDFDGDQYDEVLVMSEPFVATKSVVTVIYGVFSEPCLATQEIATVTEDFEVGDHDGDGDDELALIAGQGESVIILDVE